MFFLKKSYKNICTIQKLCLSLYQQTTKNRRLLFMSDVLMKYECKCGSIVLVFSNGAVNAMSKRYYNRLGKKYHIQDGKEERLWGCDKCINGWEVGKNQTLGEIQKIRCQFGNAEYITENKCYTL
jgi:hypothetical protein